jgi:glycosyltransferase A (GT-A) superfamily protein (DUF2064 family)
LVRVYHLGVQAILLPELADIDTAADLRVYEVRSKGL